jgi:hypothetical protein
MTKYVAIAVTLCGAFNIAHAVPQLQSDGGVGDVSASAQLMFWDRGVGSSIVNSSFAAAGQVGWSANPNAVTAILGGLGGGFGGGGGGFGGGGSAPVGGASSYSVGAPGSFGFPGIGPSGVTGTGGSSGVPRGLSVVPPGVIKYSPTAIVQNIDGSVPDGGSSLVMLGAALSLLGLWKHRKNRSA